MRKLLLQMGTLAAVFALSACDGQGPSSFGGDLPFEWPPKAGQAYPELELQGLDGEPVNLAAFRGKVLLIEPIGMT